MVTGLKPHLIYIPSWIWKMTRQPTKNDVVDSHAIHRTIRIYPFLHYRLETPCTDVTPSRIGSCWPKQQTWDEEMLHVSNVKHQWQVRGGKSQVHMTWKRATESFCRGCMFCFAMRRKFLRVVLSWMRLGHHNSAERCNCSSNYSANYSISQPLVHSCNERFT